MRNNKAQASMEFLLVVGIAITIVVIAVGLLINFTSKGKEEIGRERVNEAGKKLVENANLVYFQGEGSRVTYELDFPEVLQNITVDCYDDQDPPNKVDDITKCVNSELIFNFTDGGQRVFLIRNVPMVSEINYDSLFFKGRLKLKVYQEDVQVGPGEFFNYVVLAEALNEE